LVYELFRGAITVAQLDWSERQIRDFVATRKSTNPHLGAAVGMTSSRTIVPPLSKENNVQ